MSLPLACRLSVRHISQRAKEARTKELLSRIIRVDHAGELGAERIYEGQIAVLGRTSVGPIIKEMKEQEQEHLDTFNRLIVEERVRPTAMLPLWNVAGFVLGAGTALISKEAAMACTVAVESVIGEHYNSQIRDLMEDDPEQHKELLLKLKKFRDDELHHHDTGLEHDAEKTSPLQSAVLKGLKAALLSVPAPMYEGLTQVIKMGCKGAIWISERI